MAMLTSHPAPGIGEMIPGVYASGRPRRPTMGEIVPATFRLPDSSLSKSLAQVSGIPTSVGPSPCALHGCDSCECGMSGICGGCGMGDITLPLIGDVTTMDMVKYGAVIIGGLWLFSKLSKRSRSRSSGKRVTTTVSGSDSGGLLG